MGWGTPETGRGYMADPMLYDCGSPDVAESIRLEALDGIPRGIATSRTMISRRSFSRRFPKTRNREVGYDRLNQARLSLPGRARPSMTPETETTKEAALDGNRPEYLRSFREAWTGKQDAYHEDFFTRWAEWSPPVIRFQPRRVSPLSHCGSERRTSSSDLLFCRPMVETPSIFSEESMRAIVRWLKPLGSALS